MKLGGSKRALYEAASPPDYEPLDEQWPRARIGTELVRRVLDRRDAGTVEPWISALLAVQDSPDPVAARREFAAHYIGRLRRRTDGGEHDQAAAEAIAALLMGLAVAARTLGLLEKDREWVIDHFGGMVQSLVDRTT
jgi:hypothetical protein